MHKQKKTENQKEADKKGKERMARYNELQEVKEVPKKIEGEVRRIKCYKHIEGQEIEEVWYEYTETKRPRKTKESKPIDIDSDSDSE